MKHSLILLVAVGFSACSSPLPKNFVESQVADAVPLLSSTERIVPLGSKRVAAVASVGVTAPGEQGGDGSRLWWSEDGGQTWRKGESLVELTSHAHLAVLTAGPEARILVAGSAGVVASDLGGGPLELLFQGSVREMASGPTGHTIVCLLNEGETVISRDAGQTWQPAGTLETGQSAFLSYGLAVGTREAYALDGRGTIHRASLEDETFTWERLFGIPDDHRPAVAYSPFLTLDESGNRLLWIEAPDYGLAAVDLTSLSCRTLPGLSGVEAFLYDSERRRVVANVDGVLHTGGADGWEVLADIAAHSRYRPHELALSPDGQALYAHETLGSRLWRVPLSAARD